MGIDDPVSRREFIYAGAGIRPIPFLESDLENILESKRNGEMKIIIHYRC